MPHARKPGSLPRTKLITASRGIASVPPKVLDALTLATKIPNPREKGEKAVEIASQPGSGLKVSDFLKDDDGTILQYVIVVASAPQCTVAMMIFHSERHFQFRPPRIPPEPATSDSWIDEFDGSSLGSAYGITYSSAPSRKGAVFSRVSDTRIEYRNLPSEGTLEWWVLVNNGYHYEKFALHKDDSCAVLFSSDASGGDVTWPGATRLVLCKNGDITLDMAEKMYSAPHQTIKSEATPFRFNEWHAVGISFGSQVQAIALDGAVLSVDSTHKQCLGAAGNHQSPVDIPTIGQTVSGFWNHHQYDGGFEGIVGRFRASGKQRDWLLSNATPPAESTAAENLNSQVPAATSGQDASTKGVETATRPVQIGQTTAEVTAQLGRPLSVMNYDSKTIYHYNDMEITFVAGMVSDIAQTSRQTGRLHIRVRNSSTLDFNNVVVNRRQFGDIRTGATTGYQTLERAYNMPLSPY